MVDSKIDVGGFIILLAVRIAIAILSRKRKAATELDLKKSLREGNNSVFTSVRPFSLMLSLPFFIFRNAEKGFRNLVIITNVFTGIFYMVLNFLIYRMFSS